ncbi:contactin-like [Babylonia areolata]|uniref:contactin-like n=1 Tax=Babylonia areolata TaxID=304850 RepID=UPI003FCF0547
MAVRSSRDLHWWFTAVATWMVTVSADCPLGWETHNDHCYHFVFYPDLTYPLAAVACQMDGAYLLSVNTNEEHEFVSQWLTRHDMDRTNRWWTSGIGEGQQLQWEGDGTASALDESTKWEGEEVRRQANLHVVYKFTTLTNTYLWSRQKADSSSPYICEISHLQAFRISQARRDHSFGTEWTDPREAPRGPRFTREPHSVVVVGRLDAAVLECVVDSSPPSSYLWYRVTQDGVVAVETDSDDRYSLTNGRFSFQRPDAALDAGEYFCVASNPYGQISSSTVTVSFGYLGEFSNDPPGAVRANQYLGTYIDCNPPRYNPELSYQWYKSPGAQFLRSQLNHHQFISRNGRLYLSEAHLADAGTYHCLVTLTAPRGQPVTTTQPPSAASLGIELILRGDTATEYGPLIHNDFPAVYPTPVLRGVDLRVECFAYGRLPLYYSWRRDNGPIPHKARYTDLNRVLLIPDLQLEDSGRYTCRVERGTRASDEKTLSIAVEAAPFFVFPLRDQHVDVNTSFSLRCQAMGVPLPRYAWFKDARPLTSTLGEVEVRGNVVTFTRADPEKHSGMYQCSATNVYGTSFSSAQVRVLEFKPSFAKRPLQSSQQATVGGNTTLICAPEAAPVPQITWYHDGRDLGLTAGAEGQGRLVQLANGNLLITQVQASDQGEYTCTAVNARGSDASTGILTVVSQTTLSTPPQNGRVQVNESAFLSCQASVDRRHQDLAYVWTFNGHLLDLEHLPEYRPARLEGLQGLHVINAQFRHEGWYQCTAVTVGDKVSAAAFLTVRGPPSEPAGLHVRNDGNDVIVTWKDGSDRGSAIIHYVIELRSNFFPSWRVNVDDLTAARAQDSERADQRLYRVADLSPGSSYSFRVKAVNEYGVGTASLPSAFVKVPDARPKKAPEDIATGHSTVGTLAFTWKVPFRDTVSDDVSSFVTFIGGENYFLPYEVKVAAFNSKGQGPNSTSVVVMSQEGMPLETPRNVWAEDFNATAFIVHWDPVINTRDTMKGKLLGFQINYWLERDPTIYNWMMFHCEDCEEGMVIGLHPNDDYWISVHVFTSAGVGPKGEDYRVSTVLNAPLLYPEYVSVYSMDGPNVHVTWRGVPIGLEEEPLIGYKVLWWPATENPLTASVVEVEGKYRTWAVIEHVQSGIVYGLRVQGYNNGGDGQKSPTVFFTLEGQVRYNVETTEILATGTCVTALLWLVVISCLGQLVLLP